MSPAITTADADPTTANTQEDPQRVAPGEHPHGTVRDGELLAQLPPASWSMFVLTTG